MSEHTTRNQTFLALMILLACFLVPVAVTAWWTQSHRPRQSNNQTPLSRDPQTLAAVERGKKIFADSCLYCHSLDGSRSTGPSMQGIYGRVVKLTTGPEVMVTEQYLRESLLEPDAKVVMGYLAGTMPRFEGAFNESQIQDLLGYLKSLQ